MNRFSFIFTFLGLLPTSFVFFLFHFFFQPHLLLPSIQQWNWMCFTPLQTLGTTAVPSTSGFQAQKSPVPLSSPAPHPSPTLSCAARQTVWQTWEEPDVSARMLVCTDTTETMRITPVMATFNTGTQPFVLPGPHRVERNCPGAHGKYMIQLMHASNNTFFFLNIFY